MPEGRCSVYTLCLEEEPESRSCREDTAALRVEGTESEKKGVW